MRRTHFRALAAMAALLLASPAGSASHSALRIGWGDLRPAGQKEGLLSPAAADLGRELSDGLGGSMVQISGFLLPSDLEGSLVYEFILVPMAGACSHSRQPPPNQIVRVTPQLPFTAEGVYQLVTVKGVIVPGFDKAQLFMLDGVRVVESGYRIGSAVVEVNGPPGPLPAGDSSPWKFLGK